MPRLPRLLRWLLLAILVLCLLGAAAAQGGSLEEVLPILRERERQCEVARRGAAKRRAKKRAESK